jgi:hypothetical protein
MEHRRFGKSLEAPLKGANVFIIANADTVLSQSNKEVLAEFYPGVPFKREIGPNGTLLSIEKARRILGYEPQYSWRKEVSPLKNSTRQAYATINGRFACVLQVQGHLHGVEAELVIDGNFQHAQVHQRIFVSGKSNVANSCRPCFAVWMVVVLFPTAYHDLPFC